MHQILRSRGQPKQLCNVRGDIRELQVARHSFQHLYFDGSLQPVFITDATIVIVNCFDEFLISLGREVMLSSRIKLLSLSLSVGDMY